MTKTAEAISIHGGKPANGIDVTHWNGEATEPVPDWVRFYGMKAVHIGGAKMVNGVDPLFEYNRNRAWNARECAWSAMYLYLVSDVPQVDQILKLADTVGRLREGECVMIDWEEADITMLDEEAFTYLNAIYPNRWMMYVNDSTQAMVAWMAANQEMGSVPIVHPDWRPNGWQAAKHWDAAVWQLGVGRVPGYVNCIDIDLVMDTEAMDRVCDTVGWNT